MYQNFVYDCITRGKRYHVRHIGREGAKARGHKANFELRKLLLYGPRAELFFLEFSEKMSQR